MDIRDLYAIVYNDSDKQILIAGDKKLFCYDIKTDKFGYYNVMKDDRLDSINNITRENYRILIENQISKNIIYLVENVNYSFTDNIYQENEIVKRINAELAEKAHQNSILK